MRLTCDLCRSTALEPVYAPQHAQRKRVTLCAHCGLLQSIPRERTSGSGHRSHLRHAKGLRAEANLATLRPFLNKAKPLRVLDIGAHRGAFALELKAAYAKATIVGIEPNAHLVAAWAGRPGFTWLNARFEDTRLEDEGFDLIYSCHTLERLKSAREALLAHRAALAPGGYLLIEVPNVARIADGDIVDEFFAEKHHYHFSRRTLIRLLGVCGLRAVAIADTRDTANLTVVAVKGDEPRLAVPADPNEVEAAAALISTYQATRLKNVSALAGVARTIDAMAPRKVAVWGAGRLLGNLIENGGLKPQSLAAVVDKNLIRYTGEVHGVPLSPPDVLARLKPDIVVVLSRSLEHEIRREAEAHVPGAEVIAYAELLERAKAHAAA
jgi:2-polyprenyl-3-methyl-5-hydroxy-6-metoxy-1,4-benzoquinol methylase